MSKVERQMTPEEIEAAYLANLKKLKEVSEQNQKLFELVDKLEENKRALELKIEDFEHKLNHLEEKAKVIEHTQETVGVNPLVAMFTHRDPMALNDKPRYSFELIFYDFYRQLVPLWSVQAVDIVMADELRGDGKFPIYDAYVKAAAEKLEELREEDPDAELFGIQLTFDADTKD